MEIIFLLQRSHFMYEKYQNRHYICGIALYLVSDIIWNNNLYHRSQMVSIVVIIQLLVPL